MTMKKLLSLLASLLFITSVSALTYTVTVPEGTKACYIAGAMTGWSQVQMTNIGTNKYQIDIPDATSAHKYKYCSGPSWTYVEKSAAGGEISDRSYNADDVVVKWGVLYDPGVVVGNIILTANVPADTPDGEVYIAGSFQGFDPETALQLTKVTSTKYTITIPDVTDIAYKLLCGKSWGYVEVNADGTDISDRSASTASPNVEITVGKWKSLPGQSTDGYTYLTEAFPFAPLEGTRRIWVYLPPDYETETEKRYPVLYMHDGQNVFENGGFGSWAAHNALNQLYQDGKPVGIVVAINNSAGRMSEYTPFPNPANAPVANGDNYLQAIIDNIIPYINANYRTLTDRENTGIAGSSLGGLISYYAALKQESVFGKIGVVSPSFWYCKNDLATYLNGWNGESVDNTKMYFICGDDEGSSTVTDMQEFYDNTLSKGYKSENMKYEVVAGGGHNEASWAAQIGRIYEFLFDKAIVGITPEQGDNNQIKIYSQRNTLNIELSNEPIIDFYLYDMLGKQVLSKSLKENISINNINTGAYIYKVQSKDKSYSGKVLVP